MSLLDGQAIWDGTGTGEEGSADRPAGARDGSGSEYRETSKVSRKRRAFVYRAGEVIAGKYELIRPLSQGGMGSVWVARNCDLDVQVAIKLIRPDLDATFVSERFVAEARLAARIEHPAIVSVYDLGHTELNDPYIVMELLRGEDLRSVLEQTPRLQATYAVQLLLPVAEALATAHAKGVVHRDLKPENIFIAKLDDRLQPKVVDFGIAKGEFTPRRITRAGAVVGSPDYMSPEQARGLEDVDQRADVWAFSVVLYECLTGSPPFADSSYEALLRDILEKPVTPITERGVLDPELWAILERGLAKDRDQRYARMRDLGRALAHWLRARWVDEDVCGHSLRATWLRETELGRGSYSGAELLPTEGSTANGLLGQPTLELRQESAVAAVRSSSKTTPAPDRRWPRWAAAWSWREQSRYVLAAGLAVSLAALGKSVFLEPSQASASTLDRMPAMPAAMLAAPQIPVPVVSPADLAVAPAELKEKRASTRPAVPAARAYRPQSSREVLVQPVQVSGAMLPTGKSAAQRSFQPVKIDDKSQRSARDAERAKSVAPSKRQRVVRVDPVFGF